MKTLNKLKTFLVIFCLATTGLVLVTTSGCISSGSPHETVTQDKEDHDINARVVASLQATDYQFPHVKVETVDRTVKLTGSVDTPAHKEEAGQLAQQGINVKMVINHIAVR